MPSKRSAPGRKKRILRRLITLPLILAVAFVGWYFLRPILSDETIPTYAAYTASRGDVRTSRSFSASAVILRVFT